ncbi:MAG: hypothetical protein AB202_02680 [Parcubacteria bacterium C7867-007]|nr:MAG: hypothetical protein AB202_02680 [Parcubacteria bacterium C7867-007]
MENSQPNEYVSSKERRERKQQAKLEAKNSVLQKRRAAKVIRWIGWSLVGAAIIGSLVWFVLSQPKTSDSEIISRTGIHWHPELEIYVKGAKVEFPANIGIGVAHQPVHTHEDAVEGVVHLEFEGLVRKSDTTLGQFFKSWGKDIRSLGANVTMTVNGQENIDLENYQMQDKDEIVLRYE